MCGKSLVCLPPPHTWESGRCASCAGRRHDAAVSLLHCPQPWADCQLPTEPWIIETNASRLFQCMDRLFISSVWHTRSLEKLLFSHVFSRLVKATCSWLGAAHVAICSLLKMVWIIPALNAHVKRFPSTLEIILQFINIRQKCSTHKYFWSVHTSR